MKGFAVSTFKTVAGVVLGVGVGIIGARASLGAYALDGDTTGLVMGGVTALSVMSAGYIGVGATLKSTAARFATAVGILAGAFAGANGSMERTLTSARINDVSYERTLGFSGACAKAQLQKFGEGVRLVLPQNCTLKQ